MVAVKSNLCKDVNPYPESNGRQIGWNVWNVPGEGGGRGQVYPTNERKTSQQPSLTPLGHTPILGTHSGSSQASFSAKPPAQIKHKGMGWKS